MKYLLLLAFMVGCSQAPLNNDAKIKKHIEIYKTKANELVKLNNANASKSKLNKLGLELIAQAKPIMIAYKDVHKECGELLDFVMKKSMAMTKLNLEQIEAQYHDGEALPKSPDSCYEAKELVVHPATVVILTNQKKLNKELRTQIDDEIEEVIAHIDLL